MRAHLHTVRGLARYLVWHLLDLPDLAMGEVGAVAVGRSKTSHGDGWLCDFAAGDGDEEGMVAGRAAEEGRLEVWAEMGGT